MKMGDKVVEDVEVITFRVFGIRCRFGCVGG